MPAEPGRAAPLEQCALLFALPLSREDFDSALRGTSLADYGSQLANAGDADAFWDERYERSANAGVALGQEAERGGASLFRRAGLADLAEATRRCSFVILFAHMAGAFFRPAQLRDDDAIRARIADPAGPFAAWMDPVPDDEAVDERLNELIEQRRLLALLPDMVRKDGEASLARGQALCRDLIDEWLEELVEPGNRVELHDGLHTPGQFASAIAPGFAGEIDLATCGSAVVAAVVGMRFGSRIRLSDRAALTVPYPEFVATREALRLFARTGGSYLDARVAIARIIDETRRKG